MLSENVTSNKKQKTSYKSVLASGHHGKTELSVASPAPANSNSTNSSPRKNHHVVSEHKCGNHPIENTRFDRLMKAIRTLCFDTLASQVPVNSVLRSSPLARTSRERGVSLEAHSAQQRTAFLANHTQPDGNGRRLSLLGCWTFLNDGRWLHLTTSGLLRGLLCSLLLARTTYKESNYVYGTVSHITKL